MPLFSEVLKQFREESKTQKEKGTKFEELIKRYLLTDKLYADRFEWVSMWGDFFARSELGGHDTGIDLVAKDKYGQYWAIQCKCYAEDTPVSKADMDSFLATSGRTFTDENGVKQSFSQRLVVASTDNWGANALEVLRAQETPVNILKLSDLDSAQVNWMDLVEGKQGDAARKDKYTLRRHQAQAYNNAMKYFKDHDRGRMIMACGTGKTFTSLKIAEGILAHYNLNEETDTILFLAPSISLVGQTLREWVHNAERELNPICVCSDTTVSKKRIEDDGEERVEDLGVPSTTNPKRIFDEWKKGIEKERSEKILTVIFSTYQSLDAVIEAQGLGLPDFDLIICDEAHRTTGVIIDSDESNFTKVHSNDNVRADRRLYMTATPRLYGAKGKETAEKASVALCSMDDKKLYGEEFYRINFGEAVEQELLSDYKVLILTVTEKDIPELVKKHWTGKNGKEIDADTRCKIWGCLHALAKHVAGDETVKNTDPRPMKSAVAFSRSIAVSKAVTELFNEMAAEPASPTRLQMRHIDGAMNAMTRERLLNWLKEDSEICHVLSNVRCLSEGVDVPALDSVMFLDSKGSLVDVVQSVGRVMRKAPGKQYGYIIIPIVIPENVDPEDALDDNDRYKVVWQVLRALRSHDERLEAEINTFNYRKDRNGKKDHIHIGGVGGGSDGWIDEPPIPIMGDGTYTVEDFGNHLMARLVLKVGNREYIENWAKQVAEIAPILSDKLTEICYQGNLEDKEHPFNRYVRGLRSIVNNDVTESQAIDMLVQQIVTKPIFEKLFAKDGFVMQNPVSKYIDGMLSAVHAQEGLKDIQDSLDRFYRSVELTLNGIDTTDGKQKVITALYEKFFKNAFPKDQSINGVVYTPQEIVDFIIHSCVDILKSEFGIDINDEDVNILDPFTGTGTFIARLLESGVITKDNIARKYMNELFANEITLLAYYIANVNIENTYQRITGSQVYTPFENILLTDTFNIEEICKNFGTQLKIDQQEYFGKNKARIRKEHNTPITIILGNPPYGARQKSGNDDAKKRKYLSGIDWRIKETYLDESLITGHIMPNSVYDNYIRAFRWASDRIGDNDGLIAFVTPNGWMSSAAFEGFRKTIESEFSKIIVFDLRGNKGTTDEMRRIEGRNVFEYSSDRGGCTTGIAITLLVKRAQHKGPADIKYCDISSFGDRLKGYEKRELISKCYSFSSMESESKLTQIIPNSNGDWLIQRNDNFKNMIPLAGDTSKKFENHCENTIFTGYSRGYGTARDAWMYNSSKSRLQTNMQLTIEEYTRQTKMSTIEYIPEKIKWGYWLIDRSKRGQAIVYDEKKICESIYRPFCKMYYYNDTKLCNSPALMPRLYPVDGDNLTICMCSVGDKKDYSCLITNCATDLHLVGTSQCFPLYWYDVPDDQSDSNQKTLIGFSSSQPVRHSGISDFAQDFVSKLYSRDISKEDIFYYVYGYLHSPDYRETFSDDLKLSLPRIDFVKSFEEFIVFSDAGRKLADLHLHYEHAPLCSDVKILGNKGIEQLILNKDQLYVKKMKLDEKGRTLVYNDYVTIADIPESVFRYTINGRSALAWLVDQYQYSIDKESGIVNDPNEYAGPEYIFKLVLSIITVSIETMKIVDALPKLSFDKEERADE
ncbi:type ISP restriction/modification enzyme [Methanomethylophilus alvi]|uniref:type ISP restriction/modification enzyme n=1 Tax=Methanomethylophilus alvi TaxID=1291540 RepID=UPI0037DCF2F7